MGLVFGFGKQNRSGMSFVVKQEGPGPAEQPLVRSPEKTAPPRAPPRRPEEAALLGGPHCRDKKRPAPPAHVAACNRNLSGAAKKISSEYWRVLLPQAFPRAAGFRKRVKNDSNATQPALARQCSSPSRAAAWSCRSWTLSDNLRRGGVGAGKEAGRGGEKARKTV